MRIPVDVPGISGPQCTLCAILMMACLMLCGSAAHAQEELPQWHGGRSAALRGTGQLFGSTPASDRLAVARDRNAPASFTQRGYWKSYERFRPCTIWAQETGLRHRPKTSA